MKLSIITPSYNGGKFIEKAIKSIINQKSSFELEYIIIDCLSSDNTSEIVNKYSEIDTRIKFVSEPDTGQSNALNKGFKLASGDIVAWLNTDDEYLIGTFEKVYQTFAADKSILWLYGFTHFIDAASQKSYPYISYYKKFVSLNFNHTHLLIENFISQPSVFFKKEILKKVDYIDESLEYAMDYDLWLKFSNYAKPFVLNSFLASFRLHNNSKTGMHYKETFDVGFKVAKRYTDKKIILALHCLQVLRTVSVYRLIFLGNYIFTKLKKNFNIYK